jgi:hypothetical protein
MSCPIAAILGTIDRYQTLIAGLLALLGAWWTVRRLSEQIRQTAIIETDRRERRNLAARTVMPAALSALVDYATACLKFLEQFGRDEYGLVTPPPGISPPSVPSEAMLTLRECIQFGDYAVAEIIADMISKIQIQQARLVDILRFAAEPGGIITQENINTYTVDALEVIARASKLFPYARRDLNAEPLTPPTTDDIRRAARLRGIDEQREGVYARIDRWTPNQERA